MMAESSDTEARRILALARDFMGCRILLTGAELDLFTLLAGAPLTAAQTAAATGADLRALTILLDALAALGLLAKEEDRYRCLAPLSGLLAAGGPASVLPMVLHAASLWRRWSALTAIVRGEVVPGRSEPGERDFDELRAFIEAMHVVAAPLAGGVAAAAGAGEARALLDVGGGPGTYTIAFLRAAPALRATLFDRPEVIAIARRHVADAGLLDRVAFAAGDFYRDELPPGHDLALLSAIIHQNSPAQNIELYGKVHRALVRGGRIIIRDHVMTADRTAPVEGAIFAVNMLVGTAGGGTYTFAEIARGLAEVGFADIRLSRAGGHMDAIVEARKP
jgi:hypothetical protein